MTPTKCLLYFGTRMWICLRDEIAYLYRPVVWASLKLKTGKICGVRLLLFRAYHPQTYSALSLYIYIPHWGFNTYEETRFDLMFFFIDFGLFQVHTCGFKRPICAQSHETKLCGNTNDKFYIRIGIHSWITKGKLHKNAPATRSLYGGARALNAQSPLLFIACVTGTRACSPDINYKQGYTHTT